MIYKKEKFKENIEALSTSTEQKRKKTFVVPFFLLLFKKKKPLCLQ